MQNKLLILALLGIFFQQTGFAQLHQKGIPTNFKESFLEKHGDHPIPQLAIPLLSWSKLERIQAQNPNFTFESGAVDVDIDIRKSGEWIDMEDGSKIWRLKITASGAESLMILYEDFYLPPDAKFYLYTENEDQILGAFTSENSKKSGKFSTETTYGESVYLEYHEPPNITEPARIQIKKILQKLPKGRSGDEFGFGTTDACHVNINCDQGEIVQNYKRGVVRIMLVLQSGNDIFAGFCTGALMNNTAQDQTPYLLTAYHCIVEGFTPLYDQWQFNFGYEAPTCDNPSTEPIPKTLVGAEMVAGDQDPDFLLLKIANPVPSSYRPYYAGWNAGMQAIPQNSKMIHHACGDIKKLTIDNQNTATIHPNSTTWENYTASPNTHFKVNFDEGFSQVGASGGPLIGSDGLVYGQLHGGVINRENCEIINLFYGRLAIAWDGNDANSRLQDWLDPINSGTTTLEGFDPFKNLAIFSGLLQTPSGEGIGGASILIEGEASTQTVQTDNNGQFNLELPRTSSYQLTFNKNVNYLNGVTTFDLVKIRRHILGLEPFDDNFKSVAADVNISGTITTFDIIEIQKLILGITQGFPSAPSWGFVSPQGNLFNILTLNDLQPEVNLNIIGVKMGDVNYSAKGEE